MRRLGFLQEPWKVTSSALYFLDHHSGCSGEKGRERRTVGTSEETVGMTGTSGDGAAAWTGSEQGRRRGVEAPARFWMWS